MAIPFKIATVTLGSLADVTLTDEQRAAAERTVALWFGVAKKLTQAQCDANNRASARELGANGYAPIYPGWFTFLINAKGEFVDGCGEYASYDAAIWNFHTLMQGADLDWEEHRRFLGYPPSRIAA